MDFISIATIYLCLVNFAAFLTFGWDKRKARKEKWRISEKTLFLLCLAGGSVGGIIGMHFFRHKTLKKAFTIGLPLILILQLGILFYVAIKFF